MLRNIIILFCFIFLFGCMSEQEKRELAEEKAWKQAQTKESLPKLEQFLVKFPQGKHHKIAQEKIQKIQKALIKVWLDKAITSQTAVTKIQYYSKIIGLTPTAKMFYLRGAVYLQQEKDQLALKDFDIALKIDPKQVFAINGKGSLFRIQGKFKQALQEHQKAILIDPKFASSYSSRGRVYEEMKKPNLALQDYNKAIQLDLKKSNSYFYRGSLYLFTLEKYQIAIQDFSKAIELNSKQAKYYESRGRALLQLKKTKEAIQDFSKAIQLDPSFSSAYIIRGHAFDSLGKLKEAIRDYNQAIKSQPLAPNYFNRGMYYLLRKGEVEKAIRDFTDAGKINIAYGYEGFMLTAQNYKLEQKNKKALQIYQEYLRLFGDQGAQAKQQVEKWILELTPKKKSN